MNKMYLSTVVFAFLIATVNCLQCDETVRRLIDTKLSASQGSFHSNAVVSNNSDVCPGSECCSGLPSEQITQSSVQQLQSTLRASATHLRAFLRNKISTLKEVLVEALSTSEQSTLQVFKASYPRLLPHVKPVLHTFFGDLKGLIDVTSDNSSLEQSLSKFWDDMFPVVYHSAVHAKMNSFTPTYSDCIRKSQRTIRPWGIVPALVNEPIVRAIESATLLLHALHVGSKVVETAETYELPPECQSTTTRMVSCGLCNGVSEPPCRNLCLNVARGCLAPLTEIGAGWTDWVNGVARAGKALKTATSVFQRLPDHLPDAVLVAMETGPKLQKKVRRQCGPPTHETDSAPPETVTEETTTDDGQDFPVSSSTKWRGEAVIKQLVREMYANRDWWNQRPNLVCLNISGNANQEPCWNGDSLGTYTRELAGVGAGTQKYNPEVQIARIDNSVYAKADTLRAVKRLVSSRTTWLPESDSQMRHDTHGGMYPRTNLPDDGSGSYTAESGLPNYDGDDEDSYDGMDGSGYSSGDGMPKEDVPVHHRGNVYSEREDTKTAGAAVPRPLSCFILLLPLVAFLHQ